MTWDEILSKSHFTCIKMLEQKHDGMTNGEAMVIKSDNIVRVKTYDYKNPEAVKCWTTLIHAQNKEELKEKLESIIADLFIEYIKLSDESEYDDIIEFVKKVKVQAGEWKFKERAR